MSCNTSTSSLGGGQRQMDKRLLKAAISGDSTSMKEMASQNPSILLGTTPSGNTCLHLSSIHGHEGFCKDVLELSHKKREDVLELEESLLSKSNLEQETPLVAAVTRGHASLASFLLRRCCELELRQAISRQDKDGCNALHYAIRGGHRDLALELIAEEPALSQGVSKNNDSPMFVAVMRDFTDVAEKLLEIPDSAHGGNNGYNAMHGAMRNGNSVFAQRILETRPGLAKEANKDGYTPLTLAVYCDKIDVLRVFLEHDCSLGYQRRNGGFPLLHAAAFGGHVDAAQELLKHCPDAPYRNIDEDGCTCLHTAVRNDHAEFVEFIFRTPQLSKLVNMQDNKGKTALHYAVQKCNPKIVAALLSHKDIDTTVIDNCGWPAAWELSCFANHAKTLNWNEVIMLMLRSDPQDATSIRNINMRIKQQAIDASRNDAKSLMQTYTSNTSLVAILIATITFAAAFTLPGGYSNDAGSEGLPIMSKKFALQAFLIFDTLAMCSSFAVAFICIIARWEDYEFLIYYISSTKKLMWFAYVSTTTAFSTGLYTVLATRLRWLAIAICVLVVLLPFLTKLLGECPVLKLRFRLGKTFNSELLEMV